MKIERNRIYVMPSNVDISITDGTLGFDPSESSINKQHLPIISSCALWRQVRKSQAIGGHSLSTGI